MEVKRQDNNIVVCDGERVIEIYEFGKEIDFSALVNYLIELCFSSKISFVDNIDNKSEQEQNLISFVQKIIDDYNSKVDRFIQETKKG